MNVELVKRHIPGVCKIIWSAMFIETLFMRYGHGNRGIIGIALTPEIWGIRFHICIRLEDDVSLILS